MNIVSVKIYYLIFLAEIWNRNEIKLNPAHFVVGVASVTNAPFFYVLRKPYLELFDVKEIKITLDVVLVDISGHGEIYNPVGKFVRIAFIRETFFWEYKNFFVGSFLKIEFKDFVHGTI